MFKKMLKAISLGITATLIFVTVSFAGEKPMQIRFSHIFPPDVDKGMIHASAEIFKSILETRSGGRFEVKIYPAGSLGMEIDQIEAVKNGVIEMNSASMVGLSRAYLPSLIFFSPYLFKNEDVASEILEGPFGQKILDGITQNAGVTALDYLAGYTFMAITNNKRPIKSPGDFKGIKFRVMDPMGISMFKAFGASATTIAFSELFTSLQTGVVEGQTNPPEVADNLKLNEVQKYMTLAKSQYAYQILICNTKWLNGLSPQDKKLVIGSWNAARRTMIGTSAVIELKTIKKLAKTKMEINTIPAEDMEEFAKLGRPAGLKFIREKAGDQIVDELLQAIAAAEKKLGY